MPTKIFFKSSSLALVVGGLIFFLMPVYSQPLPTIPTNKLFEQTNLKTPFHLKIPKIKVNALIENTGLTTNGLMGVPKNFNNVAWFKLGPPPGENGNAVIDGHYGIKKGKAAVFNNLSKLKLGDKLYIKNKKTIVATFIVTKIKLYDSTADASEIFISGDKKAHLNLITCEGVWDKVSKRYTKHLVIFTDKI